MPEDRTTDAPDVDDRGLSAEEREREQRRERLYRLMRAKWRRS